MSIMINKWRAVIAGALLLPSMAFSAPISVLDNQTIIDNSPFYSVGPEDLLGSGNFAVNTPAFVNIPYIVFDFGAVTSVSQAFLNFDFGSIFGAAPAEITLYVGEDDDGIVSVTDRFMGTAIDTFSYYGGESRSIDVASHVNSALMAGNFFAARLEATVAPADLDDYYGGEFTFIGLDAVAAPEPETFLMLLLGIPGLLTARRKTRIAADLVQRTLA